MSIKNDTTVTVTAPAIKVTRAQMQVIEIVTSAKNAQDAEDVGCVSGHKEATSIVAAAKKGIAIGRKSGNEEREGTLGMSALAADRASRKNGSPGLARVRLAYERLNLAMPAAIVTPVTVAAPAASE